MRWKPEPTLVTLEGEELRDYEDIAEYMGIEYNDVVLIGSGAITTRDLYYLNAKYPEYMGAWPVIIAKIAGAIGSGVKGIVSAVKKRKAEKKAKSQANSAAAQQQALMLQMQQQQAAKAAQTKKLLMIGIPAGVALLLIMTMMNKQRPQPATIIERR